MRNVKLFSYQRWCQHFWGPSSVLGALVLALGLLVPAVSASVCRTRCSFTGARSTSAARTSRRGCWRSSPTPRRWRRRHPRAMTSKPPLASVSLGCATSTTSTTSASSSAGQGFMASVLHFCPDGHNAPILLFCPFFWCVPVELFALCDWNSLFTS